MARSLILWSWWNVLEAGGYIMVTVGGALMFKWKPDRVGSRGYFNWAAVIAFGGLLLVVLTLMRDFAVLGRLSD